MMHGRLVAALAPSVGHDLAEDLVSDFEKVRRDLATRTLERASPGKFVETFVQCLQQILTGAHEVKPNVDKYLREVESTPGLPDGLRIIGARIARSVYAVRSKRGIAHKAELDPNIADLTYAHAGAVWLLTELVRTASGISMEEAGGLVALLQTPIGTLVEEIDGVRLVHADVSAKSEILILLHSHYPDPVSGEQIRQSLSRRGNSTVGNNLRSLVKGKLVSGSPGEGYRLTKVGYDAAAGQVAALLQAAA